MTDVTSEKLYEKLDRINNVKRNLKKVMIDIGGYELFQNDPKFETYPEILCTIQDRIETLNRMLDITIYGKELDGTFTTADITYKKIMPYLEEAQSCRMALIDNLNTKGVIADTNETLRSLVNKVLDIKSGGGKVPFEETLLTQSTENLKFELMFVGSYSGSDWYENLSLRITNLGDEPITFEEPFYYATVSTYDYSSSYSCVCYNRYPVYSHSWYDFYLMSNWGDTTELDNFADSIREHGGHIDYTDLYISDNRSDVIPLGDYGTISYMLAKINSYTYYINYSEHTNSGGSEYVSDGNYYFRMRNNENQYTFVMWSQGGYIWGGSYANIINLYNSEDVDLFNDYLTNDILVEKVDTAIEEILYSVNLPNALLDIVARESYEDNVLWKSFIYRVTNNTNETINLENPAYFTHTVIDSDGENIVVDMNLISSVDIPPNSVYNFYNMNTTDPSSIEYIEHIVELIKTEGLTLNYSSYYPQIDSASGTVYLPEDNNYYINYQCCQIDEHNLFVYYSLGTNSSTTEIVLNNNYHLQMTDTDNNCTINLTYISSGSWTWEGNSYYILSFYTENEMECIANYRNNTYALNVIQ